MRKLPCLFLLLYAIACNNREKAKSPDTSIISSGDSAVQEKTFLLLGNDSQYVEITGASSKLPVLLFIHGGPGWPQTPHLRYFNSELTKHMIVVSWDQAGCGQSYVRNPNPKDLSLAKLIEDAHELTKILKEKFKQDKINLAGFSWGSIIGLKLAEKYPEDYQAYFGVSQVLSVNENVRISRDWIKKQASENKDKETIAALKKIEKADTSVCKRPLDCFIAQFEFLNKYRGAIYRKESDTAIEKAVTAYDDYKNYDWMGAFMYSAQRLENDLFSTDLRSINEIKIPSYFFAGRHDWNVPASVTEKFLITLNAPKKELVWFENSGHEPLEEEADKFNRSIIERVE